MKKNTHSLLDMNSEALTEFRQAASALLVKLSVKTKVTLQILSFCAYLRQEVDDSIGIDRFANLVLNLLSCVLRDENFHGNDVMIYGK